MLHGRVFDSGDDRDESRRIRSVRYAPGMSWETFKLRRELQRILAARQIPAEMPLNDHFSDAYKRLMERSAAANAALEEFARRNPDFYREYVAEQNAKFGRRSR